MKLPSGADLLLLGLGCAVAGSGLMSPATGYTPGISRIERTLQQDRRFVADRRVDSFLNAVGAVWPYEVSKTGGTYDASTGIRAATGFLIDRCHVLTNMHVVYADPLVVNPPLGLPVAFGVGLTDSERDKGALQGLKFLLQGRVIAHGDTLIVDGQVHNPDSDWAVIQLDTGVDSSITPLAIAAVDPGMLLEHVSLSTAGYPSDHRARRAEGFKLKDLWRSDGELVAVVPVSTSRALLQTTIQTTPGNSGGPIYGNFAGQRHVVIGMVQSIRGNGIDASEVEPNVQVLFTPDTIAHITETLAHNPCP